MVAKAKDRLNGDGDFKIVPKRYKYIDRSMCSRDCSENGDPSSVMNEPHLVFNDFI